jgi:phage shock protein E
MTIQELIQQGAKIIDLRTAEEFKGGNVPNSINIPMNEVPQRIDDFEDIDDPIILCCLSGGRSGQATGFLQSQGIECYNGGGWMDVNYAISQQS